MPVTAYTEQEMRGALEAQRERLLEQKHDEVRRARAEAETLLRRVRRLRESLQSGGVDPLYISMCSFILGEREENPRRSGALSDISSLDEPATLPAKRDQQARGEAVPTSAQNEILPQEPSEANTGSVT